MRIQYLLFAIITVLLFTGCGAGVFARKDVPPPFGIDKRPRPSGTDLNVLLPKRVGSFEREDFPAGLTPPTNEDLNVEYKSGSDKTFLAFRFPRRKKTLSKRSNERGVKRSKAN